MSTTAATRPRRLPDIAINTRALELASGLVEQMKGHEKLDDERFNHMSGKLDETANSLTKFIGEVRQQFIDQAQRHDAQHHENIGRLTAISSSVSALAAERTGALGTWNNVSRAVTVLLALATFIALLWWHR